MENQVAILKLGDPIPLISGKLGRYFKTWRPYSISIWKTSVAFTRKEQPFHQYLENQCHIHQKRTIIPLIFGKPVSHSPEKSNHSTSIWKNIVAFSEKEQPFH